MDLGLIIKNEKVVVSSRDVARNYEKDHSRVLKDVRNIIKAVPETNEGNFALVDYVDAKGEKRPQYLMDRQGFSMLVMGFTGEKAKRFTYQYTKAFEEMTKELEPKCLEDVMIAQLKEMKRIKYQLDNTQKEVSNIRDIITINPKAEWRKATTQILNSIAIITGDYRRVKSDAYQALEERAKCNLKIRLINLRGRAFSNGMAPSKVDKLNYLDVIENDNKLKEIFISIVKEIAIKYNVSFKNKLVG